MSTLEVSNLNDGTTTVGTNYITGGSAKAWAHFTTISTTTLVESLNVSSLTDNGTGSTNVNFTNNFANDDYAIGANSNDYHATTSGTNSSSSARTVVSSSSHTAADASTIGQLVMGNLA
tara:strand:+ start:1097 stop:1453 length:357 start_codon:yes stop_codon:yes gene_type:complete